MRLITRNDASLAIGLIVSAMVIFQRPLHVLLNVAQGIEGRYHLDLVPALTLMVVLFVFHQYRKRHLANAEARAAEAEAARARVRSEELERLMTFSRALAGALDLVALQRAAVGLHRGRRRRSVALLSDARRRPAARRADRP